MSDLARLAAELPFAPSDMEYGYFALSGAAWILKGHTSHFAPTKKTVYSRVDIEAFRKKMIARGDLKPIHGFDIKPISEELLTEINELCASAKEAKAMDTCNNTDKCGTKSCGECEYKTEWNGEGLPPVGARVAYHENDKYPDEAGCSFKDWEDGEKLEVLAHKVNHTTDIDVIVVWNERLSEGKSIISECLRPIKSKREQIEDAIVSSINRSYEPDGVASPRGQAKSIMNNPKLSIELKEVSDDD